MKVTAHSLEGLQVEIEAAGHRVLADERPKGGPSAGPNPYALLLSALAACKIMTARLYAERKGWPLEHVSVELSIEKIYARDCEDCESDPDARVDIIEQTIAFKGQLSQEQLERLAEMADKCPVHRTLTSETKIRSVHTVSA